MLKYYTGFVGLIALALGCAVWISTLVTQGGAPVPAGTASRTPTAEFPPSSGTASNGGERSDSKDSLTLPARAERARVVDHVDGDTLRIIADGHSTWMPPSREITVRLLEIDTPESVDPQSPEQCYAQRASKALAEMVPLGSEVWALADRELIDPYGRTLLYLWTMDGRSVNLRLVRDGYAKAVLFEPNDMYIHQMRRAEAQARGEKRGLWGACEYFGQPRGLVAQPASSPTRSKIAGPDPSTDPRFQYCSDANDAGFGDYVAGRDREYQWYDDADGDGVVCET